MKAWVVRAERMWMATWHFYFNWRHDSDDLDYLHIANALIRCGVLVHTFDVPCALILLMFFIANSLLAILGLGSVFVASACGKAVTLMHHLLLVDVSWTLLELLAEWHVVLAAVMSWESR